MACDQELCPNWGGDGRVCQCVFLGIEPGSLGGWEPGDPVYPHPEAEDVGARTLCRLCGGSWDGELSSCPNGCVWESDESEVMPK